MVAALSFELQDRSIPCQQLPSDLPIVVVSGHERPPLRAELGPRLRVVQQGLQVGEQRFGPGVEDRNVGTRGRQVRPDIAKSGLSQGHGLDLEVGVVAHLQLADRDISALVNFQGLLVRDLPGVDQLDPVAHLLQPIDSLDEIPGPVDPLVIGGMDDPHYRAVPIDLWDSVRIQRRARERQMVRLRHEVAHIGGGDQKEVPVTPGDLSFPLDELARAVFPIIGTLLANVEVGVQPAVYRFFPDIASSEMNHDLLPELFQIFQIPAGLGEKSQEVIMIHAVIGQPAPPEKKALLERPHHLREFFEGQVAVVPQRADPEPAQPPRNDVVGLDPELPQGPRLEVRLGEEDRDVGDPKWSAEGLLFSRRRAFGDDSLFRALAVPDGLQAIRSGLPQAPPDDRQHQPIDRPDQEITDRVQAGVDLFQESQGLMSHSHIVHATNRPSAWQCDFFRLVILWHVLHDYRKIGIFQVFF